MRLHRAISAIVVVGLTLPLIVCGGDPEPPVFQVVDSAGVTVVESSRPLWEVGEGWELGEEPLIRIGVVDGDPAFQFNGITGMGRLADGTIVVADGGSQEIRYFDSGGGVVASVGGQGEGPGEFSGLSGLGTGPGGEIWAYDFSLRRITWLNESGGMVELTTLAPEPPVLHPVGLLGDGTFLLKQLWGAGEVSQARTTGLRRDGVAFVRFETSGTLVDTLGLFPGSEVYLFDEDGRGVMSTPPFAKNSVGAVWQDEVVVGTQDEYELLRYGPDGTLKRIVRLNGLDLALSPADLEAYIQDRLQDVPEESRPGLRQALEDMPAPETKPAYGGMQADEAGNLWVGEWTLYPRIPHRWTVLDPDGRWLGEVAIPGRFFPYAIGEDWALGVELDELDVEYVVLYPLRKT